MSLLSDIRPQLKTERAKEFLAQGVARRLKLIRRCVRNIFTIFPVDRSDLLNEDELDDLQISFHAFLINVHGIPDNLAWAYLLERDIQMKPTRIGLFNVEHTQPLLPADVRDYLNSAHLQNWHRKYAKDYRDALAHRIAPYLAPYVLTPDKQAEYQRIGEQITKATEAGNFDHALELHAEQDELGEICLAIAHSFLDKQAKPPILLHSQLIADARTVLEIISKVQPHLALPTLA